MMLSCLTNISVEILLKSLGYAVAFSTIFWHIFPNAVTAKSIKNYLLEICSVWTPKCWWNWSYKRESERNFLFCFKPFKIPSWQVYSGLSCFCYWKAKHFWRLHVRCHQIFAQLPIQDYSIHPWMCLQTMQKCLFHQRGFYDWQLFEA